MPNAAKRRSFSIYRNDKLAIKSYNADLELFAIQDYMKFSVVGKHRSRNAASWKPYPYDQILFRR
ncbi:hypothetical protein AJ87_48765 [Rhizobium yanglingense]|nr:hypothetical protein AJ87_48765 [Rhizobium yanglingense]